MYKVFYLILAAAVGSQLYAMEAEQTTTEQVTVVENQPVVKTPTELEIEFFLDDARSGKFDRIRLFLEEYPHAINVKGKSYDFTALHRAIQGCFAGEKECLGIVAYLRDQGANRQVICKVDTEGFGLEKDLTLEAWVWYVCKLQTKAKTTAMQMLQNRLRDRSKDKQKVESNEEIKSANAQNLMKGALLGIADWVTPVLDLYPKAINMVDPESQCTALGQSIIGFLGDPQRKFECFKIFDELLARGADASRCKLVDGKPITADQLIQEIVLGYKQPFLLIARNLIHLLHNEPLVSDLPATPLKSPQAEKGLAKQSEVKQEDGAVDSTRGTPLVQHSNASVQPERPAIESTAFSPADAKAPAAEKRPMKELLESTIKSSLKPTIAQINDFLAAVDASNMQAVITFLKQFPDSLKEETLNLKPLGNHALWLAVNGCLFKFSIDCYPVLEAVMRYAGLENKLMNRNHPQDFTIIGYIEEARKLIIENLQSSAQLWVKRLDEKVQPFNGAGAYPKSEEQAEFLKAAYEGDVVGVNAFLIKWPIAINVPGKFGNITALQATIRGNFERTNLIDSSKYYLVFDALLCAGADYSNAVALIKQCVELRTQFINDLAKALLERLQRNYPAMVKNIEKTGITSSQQVFGQVTGSNAMTAVIVDPNSGRPHLGLSSPAAANGAAQNEKNKSKNASSPNKDTADTKSGIAKSNSSGSSREKEKEESRGSTVKQPSTPLATNAAGIKQPKSPVAKQAQAKPMLAKPTAKNDPAKEAALAAAALAKRRGAEALEATLASLIKEEEAAKVEEDKVIAEINAERTKLRSMTLVNRDLYFNKKKEEKEQADKACLAEYNLKSSVLKTEFAERKQAAFKTYNDALQKRKLSFDARKATVAEYVAFQQETIKLEARYDKQQACLLAAYKSVQAQLDAEHKKQQARANEVFEVIVAPIQPNGSGLLTARNQARTHENSGQYANSGV